MKEKILFVEEAPEPSDIVWENQKFKTRQKITFRADGLFYTIILLALCVLGIGLIKYLQSIVKKNYKNQSNLVQFLSVFISIIITIFNKFILAIFVKKIVKF